LPTKSPHHELNPKDKVEKVEKKSGKLSRQAKLLAKVGDRSTFFGV
jgi:hypothetical protein